MNIRQISLGFTENYIQESRYYEDLFLARVIAQSKDLYLVATAAADIKAEISGKLRHQVLSASDFPAVGDFVMVDRESDDCGNAIIHRVLPRKSIFERRAAGTTGESQPIAANIDMVFVCMALDRDFNLRRLERYLSIAWASGALPVVVLTKSDLCDDIDEKRKEVDAVAPGVEVMVTSSTNNNGYKQVKTYLSNGKTVAFIGSSGVGKSTLINCLLEEEVIATKATRSDGKGRHTTTRRELIVIPTGGAVIDTPGMRELGVESADLSKSFADIDLLAGQCRFNDCTHNSEPQCAVLEAIHKGVLSAKRLENYKKLQKEARYEGLKAKQIEREKINEMFSGLGGMKNARNYIKNKSKRTRD